MNSTNRRIFLKQLGAGALGAGLLAALPTQAYPKMNLKQGFLRTKPEQEGISSSGIIGFLDAVEKSNIEFHSVMVLRHGHIVAEGWWAPFARELKHTLYSLSKSFTSSGVGLAIAEGRFSLDSTVVSFFPEDLPPHVSDNLATMTVRDLLTMSTGHVKDTIPPMREGTDENWVKVFLEQPVEKQPGTHFLYNTGATYMLSAIIQKKTGKSLLQYMKPRFFDPLEIEGMDWEADPRGINVGGYGLRVKTEDIARLGQLYLQKGKWNDIEILPEDWIKDATSSHIDSSPSSGNQPGERGDWGQGYGYQFWRCRHNGVRGDGAFGQYCIMFPDKDVVIAITSESFDMQAEMNLVWDYLLPAIKDTSISADDKAAKALKEKLKSLAIKPPVTSPSSPMASGISGKTFVLANNEFNAKSVSFKLGSGDCQFTLTDEKGAHTMKCGWGKWAIENNGMTQVFFPILRRPQVATPIAGSATWTDANTLMVTARYSATAHSDNFIFRFDGDQVNISFLNSVKKGNPKSEEKRADIKGKVA